MANTILTSLTILTGILNYFILGMFPLEEEYNFMLIGLIVVLPIIVLTIEQRVKTNEYMVIGIMLLCPTILNISVYIWNLFIE